jgi:hypothetical protein
MSSNLLIALELLLVLGIALGIGLWELRSLRRYRDEPRRPDRGRAETD